MKDEKVRDKFGTVQMNETVIEAIAGLAATEIDGVKCLAGGIVHDAITRSDCKNLNRAVRVSLQNGQIAVKLALVLDGSVSVPDVARALQEKVKNSVEIMTGNEVTSVDLVVTGVEE